MAIKNSLFKPVKGFVDEVWLHFGFILFYVVFILFFSQSTEFTHLNLASLQQWTALNRSLSFISNF